MRRITYLVITLLFSHLLIAGDSIYYELWNIDNLELIGGHQVSVFGDPQLVSTDLGDAVQFDGELDRLLVDFNPIMDAKEFTIELVFKPDACYPNNTDPRFVHIQDPDDPDEKRAMMELRINENNMCYMDGFLKTDSDKLALIDESLVHNTEEWQHIAVSYKDSVFTTYFNGIKEISGIVKYSNTIVNTLGKTSLGARMNEKKYFSGLLKTLKVSHAALDPKNFIFINDPDSVTSSIEQYNFISSGDIKMYPNPVQNELNIIVENRKNCSQIGVYITDISGKLMFNKNFTNYDQGIITINTSILKSGNYLLTLKSDLYSYKSKIVVVH